MSTNWELYFIHFWHTYEPKDGRCLCPGYSGLLTIEEIKKLKDDFTDITKFPPNQEEKERTFATNNGLSADYYIDNRPDGKIMLEQVITFIETPGNKVENGRTKLSYRQFEASDPNRTQPLAGEWTAQRSAAVRSVRSGTIGGGGFTCDVPDDVKFQGLTSVCGPTPTATR